MSARLAKPQDKHSASSPFISRHLEDADQGSSGSDPLPPLTDSPPSRLTQFWGTLCFTPTLKLLREKRNASFVASHSPVPSPENGVDNFTPAVQAPCETSRCERGGLKGPVPTPSPPSSLPFPVTLQGQPQGARLAGRKVLAGRPTSLCPWI